MHTYDRNYFKIALPAALEGLFMILLASTDLIMVGALGALSIAAVSIFLQPRPHLTAIQVSSTVTVDYFKVIIIIFIVHTEVESE